jgi:Kef-type K+ transport system membrane component KefB
VAIVILVSIRRSGTIQKLFNASEPVGVLLVVFGAAVAAAGLAGFVDFSPAVAAFLVGLLLTGEIAELARRRLDPLRELLAAIFFVYFGLSTDISEIPSMLIPAIILAILTIGTKFVTGWIAARTVATSTISRLRAGALLSARGEFSVIIAGLAATSTRVRVDDCVLRAGRARLPLTAIGDAEPLDASAMRDARRHGDPRDYLVLRAWSSRRGVAVAVADPRDPHPRWLISSRHPEQLAQAIRAACHHRGCT